MAVLPALPTVFLGVVAVWFVWPFVADPISRVWPVRRRFAADADRTAEDLFQAWSERG